MSCTLELERGTLDECPSPTEEFEFDEPRSCESCGEWISPARLQAVPLATHCVPCLEAAGDVVRIKRYDEYVGDEKVSTYYKTPNPYLEIAIDRSKLAFAGVPPTPEDYNTPVPSTMPPFGVFGLFKNWTDTEKLGIGQSGMRNLVEDDLVLRLDIDKDFSNPEKGNE